MSEPEPESAVEAVDDADASALIAGLKRANKDLEEKIAEIVKEDRVTRTVCRGCRDIVLVVAIVYALYYVAMFSVAVYIVKTGPDTWLPR